MEVHVGEPREEIQSKNSIDANLRCATAEAKSQIWKRLPLNRELPQVEAAPLPRRKHACGYKAVDCALADA